jgi:hypothetical protein
VTNKKLNVVEIYPKIFVYKNVFKDINKTYFALKESNGEEAGLFSPWTKWSHFGEYLHPTFTNHPYILSVAYLEQIKTKTKKEELQRLVILELFNNFHLVTEHYALRNAVELDKTKTIMSNDGEIKKEWQMTGPSIARYRTDIDDPIAMTYHSDYIREPIVSPGYKFAITALAYFNDNYEGGEIDFIVNGEAYKYKPEAGDFLVFPSGHPEVLKNGDSVYLHGVMPALGESKYLARMYWMKYSVGDPEWFEKEKEFGKDVWKNMQENIMQKFRDENPNKINADKERRIK